MLHNIITTNNTNNKCTIKLGGPLDNSIINNPAMKRIPLVASPNNTMPQTLQMLQSLGSMTHVLVDILNNKSQDGINKNRCEAHFPPLSGAEENHTSFDFDMFNSKSQISVLSPPRFVLTITPCNKVLRDC